MKPLILPMPDDSAIAERLLAELGAERAHATMRRFPDGESYVRVHGPVAGRDAMLVCALARPDDKVVPLLLLADTLRDLGVRSIGLVAPYLAYLRQDNRFQPGEGVTSAYFARLLSSGFEWLVTVDPHLHRYGSLAEIYRIPARVVHAAPAIATWVRGHVRDPLLIGPDSESAQWVAEVAGQADAPWIVLEKRRFGDRSVEVSVPDLHRWPGRTPVLVDDIISTGRTQVRAIARLRELGAAPPVCVGVHGIFADAACEELRAAGAGRVVTCNTIAHVTNGIDVSTLLAAGIRAITPEAGG